jgi:hypothetical protein
MTIEPKRLQSTERYLFMTIPTCQDVLNGESSTPDETSPMRWVWSEWVWSFADLIGEQE